MGAWGEGLLDDDVAGDLEVTWDEYIARGRSRDPEFWTPDQIVAFFERHYLRSRDLSGRDIAVATLAIGAFFHRDGIRLTDRLRDLVTRAASEELAKERLRLWVSPTKRKRALLAFLEAIGRKPVPLPPDPVRAEVAKWKEFSKHYARRVEISRGPFGHDEFFSLVPDWFFKLQDFVGAGTRHDDARVMHALCRYRLMHLAWYTGLLLKLPDPERLALIEAAERSNGDTLIWPS